MGKPEVRSPQQEMVCDACTTERSETAMGQGLSESRSSRHRGNVAREGPIRKQGVKSVRVDRPFKGLRVERRDTRDRNLRGCSIGRTFHDDRALCKFIG